MRDWLIFLAMPFIVSAVVGYFLPTSYLIACSIPLSGVIIVLFIAMHIMGRRGKQRALILALLFFMSCGLFYGLWSGALIELLAKKLV